MSDPDRLYRLLPAVYRQRDADRGFSLRDLLRVVGEQVTVVEDDIRQLYENWFIETCDDWVVPYIGDLIGYESIHEIGGAGDVTTALGRARHRVLVPRREVANTIRYRRRKGALALLELLASDVAGWPARAVEFSRLLSGAQALNHQRPLPAAVTGIRDSEALELIHGAFESAAYSVDIRRITSPRAPGRHNAANVGVFVWRLRSYSISRGPAYCVEEAGNHCFTFNVLGADTQLFTKPEVQSDPTEIAGELNVPAPIRRRRFEVRERGQRSGRASESYYGPGKSLMIWTVAGEEGSEDEAIPVERVVPADLSDWEYRPRPKDVAVDPVLGRIAFAPGDTPEHGIRVSYHYAFSGDMGGGEYPRSVRRGARRQPEARAAPKKGAGVRPEPAVVATARIHDVPLRYRVGRSDAAHSADKLSPDYASVEDALKQWSADAPRDAIIEIVDSDVYEEQVEIALGDRCLELRAAPGVRPVLRLVDRRAGRPDALTVIGDEGSELKIDGLLITGRGLEVKGAVSKVFIRHSTLVPGWSLHADCKPYRPNEPSITLDNLTHAHKDDARSRPSRVLIEHSIVGSLRVIQDEVGADPVEIRVCDSVIDATSATLEAVDAPGERWAHASLVVARSTVIGRVLTHAIELAENSIFDGEVRVVRRQTGCMRFCYAPPGSRTPRRFQCQPDTAVGDRTGAAKADVELRVRPEFNSTRYGTSTYCQLAETCPEEISRGAEDQSEMGVFHNLFQPQRRANLQARLDEYVPAGVDVGVIIAT